MSLKLLHWLIIIIFLAALFAVFLTGRNICLYHWLLICVSGLCSIFSAAILFLDRKK